MKVANQAHQSLLVDVQALLNDQEDCWKWFNYSEANKVADKLANFGRDNLFYIKNIMPLLTNFFFITVKKKEHRSVGINCAALFYYSK